MTVVDLYCRISSDPQEENTSLDEQEACGRAYCAEHGLIIGMVHREVFSGFQYRERDKLSLMRERYREGSIQGVVIRTLDRLSRSQVHNAILMEEMEHHEVTLHCVKEVIDDTPMGKFVRMILAFVAEMEREKIMDRTLTGRLNRAKEGKVVSGPKLLYGLQWHDPITKDYIELDEAQTAILRQAAEEYVSGVGLRRIAERLMNEGVPPPRGERWHSRTLRRILTDPRMTGKDITIFNNSDGRARQHLETVALPDGTYPRILSDDIYQKVLDRAATNARLSTRNSKQPERFLLRAGFVKCKHCGYALNGKLAWSRGKLYPQYMCPNDHSDCKHYTIVAEKLDAVIWRAVSRLADHITLLEQSIEAAMSNRSFDAELKAINNTLHEWQQKATNYQNDLEQPGLRGDTRLGVLNLLNGANAMIEQLETDKAALVMYSIDRDRERAEYEKVVAWCKRVKQEGEEMSYTMKRDFLSLLGAVVIVERQAERNAPIQWDVKVRLPQVEAVIYQGRPDWGTDLLESASA